jgi:hypothetical protein
MQLLFILANGGTQSPKPPSELKLLCFGQMVAMVMEARIYWYGALLAFSNFYHFLGLMRNFNFSVLQDPFFSDVCSGK